MAKKILKGLTIEISGDTQKFSDSMKTINQEAKYIQSQLNLVNKMLKLDPNNTELIREKFNLLSQSLQTTQEKIKSLKAAQQALDKEFHEGKITETQYNNATKDLTKELHKAELQEKLNKKEVDASKKAIEQKTGVTQLATAANTALAASSNYVALAIAAVTAAASAAIGVFAGVYASVLGLSKAVGDLAAKSAKAADDLNTLSKVTGISTASLQKYKYAADQVDVSQETISGSLKKLTSSIRAAQKGTGEASEIFKKLGVSITDSNGQLKNQEQLFYESIKALSKITDETERNISAQTLFGKSAAELNPLIEGGIDILKKYGNEAEQLGLIVSQDLLDSANDFNNSLDLIKASAEAFFFRFGSEIASSLAPSLSFIKDSIQALFANIINIFQNQGVTGLADSAGIIIENFVYQIIGQAEKVSEAGFEILTSLLNGIKNNVEEIAKAITEFISYFTEEVILLMPLILEIGVKIFYGIVEGLINSMPALEQAILEMTKELENLFNAEYPKIVDMSLFLFGAIASALYSVLEQIAGSFAEDCKFVWLAMQETVSEWLRVGQEMIGGLWVGILAGLMIIGNQINDFCKKYIIDPLVNLPSQLYEIGKNTINGLWQGMEDAWNGGTWLLKKMGEIIVDSFKDSLDIHSPSGVFEEIGKQINAGLNLGLIDSAPMPQKTLNAELNGITDSGNYNSYGSPSVGGIFNFTININGSNLSVDEISDELAKSVESAIRQRGLV